MADLGNTLVKGRLAVTGNISGELAHSLTIAGKKFNNLQDISVSLNDVIPDLGGSVSVNPSTAYNLGVAIPVLKSVTLDDNGTLSGTTGTITVRMAGGSATAAQAAETVGHGENFTILNTVAISNTGVVTNTRSVITIRANGVGIAVDASNADAHALTFATSAANSNGTLKIDGAQLNFTPSTGTLRSTAFSGGTLTTSGEATVASLKVNGSATIASATITSATITDLTVDNINQVNTTNLQVKDTTIELAEGSAATPTWAGVYRRANASTTTHGIFIANSGNVVRIGTGTVNTNGEITAVSGLQVATLNTTAKSGSAVVATIGANATIQNSAYSIAKSVPSNANFYTVSVAAGTKINVGTAINATAGTANFTVTHEPTSRTNSTDDAQTLAYSGNFTVITNVVSDETGHVTRVNTKTFTLPAPQAIPSLSITNGSATSPSSRTITYVESGSVSGHAITLTRRTIDVPSPVSIDNTLVGAANSTATAEQYLVFTASQGTAVKSATATTLRVTPSTGALRTTGTITGATVAATTMKVGGNWSVAKSGNDLVFTYA